MDRRLSVGVEDSSFGLDWRPGAGRPREERMKPGRRSFLGRGAAAVAAAMAVLIGGGTARAGNPNYLPSLYANENVTEFQAIRTHENAHVQYLINAITAAGGTPRPEPSFVNLTQPNLLAFVQTSQALENTGVGATLCGSLHRRWCLRGCGGPRSWPSRRHAGYLNVLLDQVMTYNVDKQTPSFETALTPDQVVDLAGPFITSLNGGPDLTYSTTPSAANDIAILNFALALDTSRRLSTTSMSLSSLDGALLMPGSQQCRNCLAAIVAFAMIGGGPQRVSGGFRDAARDVSGAQHRQRPQLGRI